MAYDIIAALFGPASPVPWWAWVAALVMIFWGLLVPGSRTDEFAEPPASPERTTLH